MLRGGFAAFPEQGLVHRAVGFRQRQRAKSVVVHAVGQVAGFFVLALNHGAQGAADRRGVPPVVRVLAAGEKSHDADAVHAAALVAALPVAVGRLRVGQPGQAALVDRVHFRRDLAAEAQRRVLRPCAGQCRRAPAQINAKAASGR